MSKARLFVDMDGTVARFHDEVRYLERMFEKSFFRQLTPFDQSVRGLNELHKLMPDVEIFILSATVDGEPPYCREEKNEWIDYHLPFIDEAHRIFTKVGENKADRIPGGIKQTDILYDDYNKNLDEWQNAGGYAVKCKNNINHKGLIGELWDGCIISNNGAQASSVLANKFANIILNAELTGVAALYSEKSDGVVIDGHRGTWHAVDVEERNGVNYFLMEHDTFGNDAACIYVNENGTFKLCDVWNGADDLDAALGLENDEDMEQ